MTDPHFILQRGAVFNLTSMLTIGRDNVRVGVIRFDAQVDDLISLKVRLWLTIYVISDK